MEVIPAIDIMKGEVVRLLRGDPRSATSYKSLGDPVSFAKKWEADGAQTIHIIDLDATLGLGNNTGTIKNIVGSVKAPIQVGGGIRSLESARAFLHWGVHRIILGSLAFRDEEAVTSLLIEYGEKRIVVALDHLNGSIVVDGWTASTKVTVEEAMSRFSRVGIRLFLVTSVARDGTMAGPDLETLGRLRLSNVDVIAAGGIRNADDILSLKRLGLLGVVVGKSLYEGCFSLREALEIAKE